MSDKVQGGYGFSEAEDASSVKFGLNTGARLTKFEWTPNGGKDGAEQEALDIVFNVNGREVSYRRFPVTQSYHKLESGEQVTIDAKENPTHVAVVQDKKESPQIITHIVGCFVEKADIQQAFNKPVKSFKDYCQIMTSLLPKDFSEKDLDLFFNWQWQIKGDNNQTYLQLPTKMKHGRWCQAAVEPQGESGWEKQERKNAGDNETALRYVDGEGNFHPFQRNGWFMNSAFASKQKEQETEASEAISSGSGGAGW